MHREFTDEELGAYLDGALDPNVRSAIASELAENAALRERLAHVERLDAAVRAVVGSVQPTPERFAQIVNEGFDRREGANVIPMRSKAVARTVQWRVPIAAGFALFLTAAGGYWVGVGSNGGGDVSGLTLVAAGTPLFEAIEATPSGQTIDVQGQTVTPVLSFAAADGRACREVEVASGDAQSIAILCRDADDWRVEIMVASTARPGTGYETVGDDVGAALDQVYARLGGAGAISADEERSLMENDWKP